MVERSSIRRTVVVIGKVGTTVFAWCLLMALYFVIYDLFETRAVPFQLPSREFSAGMWDDGFFHAKGSLRNDSAISAGDEIIPGTVDIMCSRSPATCTVSLATVYDGFLNLDVTPFDTVQWDARQITFGDDTAICMTNQYVIDRASESVTLIARKKATIPDYAAKSPLHPCDNIKDKNVSLGDGLQVSERHRTDFEKVNGWKFHTALAAMNVGFFFLVALWFRKRRTPQSNLNQEA